MVGEGITPNIYVMALTHCPTPAASGGDMNVVAGEATCGAGVFAGDGAIAASGAALRPRTAQSLLSDRKASAYPTRWAAQVSARPTVYGAAHRINILVLDVIPSAQFAKPVISPAGLEGDMFHGSPLIQEKNYFVVPVLGFPVLTSLVTLRFEYA